MHYIKNLIKAAFFNEKLQSEKLLFNKLSLFLAGGIITASFIMPLRGIGIELCLYKRLLGIPCPGCGLSRSIINISHAQFAQAFLNHPFGFVIYPVILFLTIFILIPQKIKMLIIDFVRNKNKMISIVYLLTVYLFVAFGMGRAIFFCLR